MISIRSVHLEFTRWKWKSCRNNLTWVATIKHTTSQLKEEQIRSCNATNTVLWVLVTAIGVSFLISLGSFDRWTFDKKKTSKNFFKCYFYNVWFLAQNCSTRMCHVVKMNIYRSFIFWCTLTCRIKMAQIYLLVISRGRRDNYLKTKNENSL